MKNYTQLCLAVVSWLLFLFTPKGICDQRVHCQWGPYGDWSECDGCTKLQTRSRAMAAYAQFGGNLCGGDRKETRSCETTKGCPLEDGCGDRFRCRSGKCISRSLVCNGDQDCEDDGHDEQVCDQSQRYIICANSIPPPNIELLGLGYDMVTGKRRAGVINTKNFGGQCRTMYSGVHMAVYRLPLSTTQYSFMVKAQNDFSDEMFTSKWHYAKDIVNRQKVSGTTTGYRNYDFHETHDKTKKNKLLVLKNNIEVAQFQSNSPQYLPISEELWRALAKLPSVYDFAAYRKVLERFGTHYMSEGSLGGSFKVVATIDEETEKQMGHSRSNNVHKVDVVGGDVQYTAQLMTVQPSNPENNWEMYSNWADSIRSFPQVIKQKLRPLSELVKEVQCAGVKKLYLRRAIEQYLTESDPCHCQACSNNGMAVMDGDVCKCICKPGTSGLACEQGSEVELQQGVIDGGWSCWSPWSMCSGDRRSRSRSCSNPAPQNGGQGCIGESTETSHCEDQDIQYLKTMEPQCFDQTLSASQKCGTPPALINGYILDPKDIYLVGSKVEYTCTEGFYLIGHSTLECTADQTWSANPGLCTVSHCKIHLLAEDVIASPLKQTYDIGEAITLSCPEDRQLLGEAIIICDASLHFSPDPANIKCSPDQTNECRCKESADCLIPGFNVCVRVGEDATAAVLTMSECEAGLRRCKGEKVSVVSILPCTSYIQEEG
ncbi:hypothetical protein PAMP_022125 [Pampus punctatissimus]